MPLTISLEDGRAACAASVTSFVLAVEEFDEFALLGASRCHGWTRLDVVTHVVAGWQEMLGGMVSVVDDDPDVDAASYWRAFAAEYAGDDPVLTLMAQRRRSASYARPASAVEQLHDVAAALDRGIDAMTDLPRTWQGHVFTAGDYLAVWAVENVVHQLDLVAGESAPASGLRLVRSTVEALLGRPLPAGWTDEEAALIGSGRTPPPGGVELEGLPALG